MASAADTPSSATAQRGSRTRRSGSRVGVLIGAFVLAVAGVTIALALGGGSPATRAHRPAGARVNATTNPLFRATSTQHAGGLPSWLPRPKVKTNRIVTATLAHPQLGIEGDTVHAVLPAGGALVTAVGPETPEQGHFPVPATTPAAFVVTFAAVTGSVPLSASAFTLLDERGVAHHAHVTALHGGPLPATVSAGEPFSVELHAILPTGSGRLIWTPVAGRQIAAWDYDVEID